MKLFSFVEGEDDGKDIIELVSCQWDGANCTNLRKDINILLRSARKSNMNKEYRKAIDEISEAFFLTDQITNDGCQQCTGFFRETMLNSLKQLTEELGKMSSGFFRDRRYREVYQFARKKLDELTLHHQAKR
ncbi:MAG: hypothetical protein AAGU19_07650 [Prolixibacteraceae bacterium]